MSDYKIKICHLYPDILNLYGDTGNITCLRERMRWRGIDAEVIEIKVGETLKGKTFDIFFIGGGQDFEQEILINDGREKKKDAILEGIEENRVFLAICGGYQILGNSYQTWDGKEYEFMGCLDFHTVGARTRMVGNYMFQCKELNGDYIVGFENHSGKTYLGESMKPMGKIVCGHGNNGEDGMEGCRYKSVYGTYSHGPILPKNPRLADLLIEKALKNKYGEISLTDFPTLDDSYENRAHDIMVARLKP